MSCELTEVFVGDMNDHLLNGRFGLSFGVHEADEIPVALAEVFAEELERLAAEGRYRTRLGLNLGERYPASVQEGLRQMADFIRTGAAQMYGTNLSL